MGVGFSFTDSKKGFVQTEVEVGRNMLSLLQQFYTIFADFRANDFYVVRPPCDDSLVCFYLFYLGWRELRWEICTLSSLF